MSFHKYSYPDSNPLVSFPAHAVKRVSLPGTGSTSASITIRAKGTYAGGAWPVMQLYVIRTVIR